MKKFFVILAGVLMMFCLLACEEKATGVKEATEPSTTVGAPEATTAPTTAPATTAKADGEGDELAGEDGGGAEEVKSFEVSEVE